MGDLTGHKFYFGQKHGDKLREAQRLMREYLDEARKHGGHAFVPHVTPHWVFLALKNHQREDKPLDRETTYEGKGNHDQVI